MKDYIRSISRKAWYLIGCSVSYLVLVALLAQFIPIGVSMILAQVFYVAILSLPLVYDPVRRMVFKHDPEEKQIREISYLQVYLARAVRLLDCRRTRPTVPKVEPSSDDPSSSVSSEHRGL